MPHRYRTPLAARSPAAAISTPGHPDVSFRLACNSTTLLGPQAATSAAEIQSAQSCEPSTTANAGKSACNEGGLGPEHACCGSNQLPTLAAAGTSQPHGASEAQDYAPLVLSPAQQQLLALARREYRALRLRRQQGKLDAEWQRKHATRPLGAIPDFHAHHRACAEALAGSRAARRRGGGVTVPEEFENVRGRQDARRVRRQAIAARKERFVSAWLGSEVRGCTWAAFPWHALHTCIAQSGPVKQSFLMRHCASRW